MAPFGISTIGFCMVSRRGSFVFSCSGADSGAQDRNLTPTGQHFGQGAFGASFGIPKNTVLRGNDLWWRCKGIPPAQMNSVVPGIHLGVLLCPQAPLFKKIYVIPYFPGKLKQGFPCCPDPPAIYPVFYSTWALARVGGMAEGP